MKTIKIKYVGFWDDFNPEEHYFHKLLNDYYDVQVVDNPDYVICSCLGKPYEYCDYPQVRIMVEGENYTPDFNLIDYAICDYPIEFGDRNFYKPGCIDAFGHADYLANRDRHYDREWLEKKEYFANFIAGHESEYSVRGDFFKALSKYKRIESCGTYLNNMPDGYTVIWNDGSKTELQKKCKFSLCFESTKNEGFITEKIIDGFFADSIPIYYGSSNIKSIINPKAFLDLSDFSSQDELIQRIIEIDNNDDEYLNIINQPVFVDDMYVSNTKKKLVEFVKHIFDQPIEEAYRRSRVYSPKIYEDYLIKTMKPVSNIESCSTLELVSEIVKRVKRRII